MSNKLRSTDEPLLYNYTIIQYVSTYNTAISSYFRYNKYTTVSQNICK